MTPQIITALEIITKHHPSICQVLFTKDGKWAYMDKNFKKPKFTHPEINTILLKTAQKSITKLPATFHYTK